MTPRARLEGLLFRLGWAGGGRAVGLLSIWLLVQRVTDVLFGVRPVAPGSVLLYSLHRYRGEPVTLEPGVRVARGDWVLWPHLNNRALARRWGREAGRKDARHWTWWTLAATKADLRRLAAAVAADQIHPRPVALFAYTLLGDAVARAGFTVRPMRPGPYRALEGFFLRGLMVLYHPLGLRQWPQIARLEPVEVWMSVETLRARHGRHPQDGPARAP